MYSEGSNSEESYELEEREVRRLYFVDGKDDEKEDEEEVEKLEEYQESVDEQQLQKKQKKIMQITIQSYSEVATYEKQVEFYLKIVRKQIPNGYQKVHSVILGIALEDGKQFQEITMKSNGESHFHLVFNCVLKIQTNEKYKYCYKVNSSPEKELRSYKFDNDLEIKVDEWNKIWIGYHFKMPENLISYQIEQNKQFPSTLFQSVPKVFENFQLIANMGQYQYPAQISSIKLQRDQIQFKQRSNCLIIEFTFEFYVNKKQYNQDKQMNFKELNNQKNKEIKLLEDKFNHHQQIYSNYTNNLNSILEELTQNNSQVSNEQIKSLLTPIKIPTISEDPAFEKCKKNLININNILDDIQENKIRIQDQYDALKIEYDLVIQQLSDYEKISVKKNDFNQYLIKKLKQELDFKKKEIENFKKQQDQTIIQYRIRIINSKMKYHEEIQKKEQELIDLVERQKEERELILDTDRKIKLLEIEKLRLKNLIREKDTFIINQSDYVTTLLKQIKNYKELLKVQRLQ